MSFPSSLTLNGQTWSRESCSDGWVYRVTGVQNPHVTIHDVADDDFYQWLRTGVYHLRYSSAGGLWEYQRGEPYAFKTKSGKNVTNKTGGEEPQANSLAKDFWSEIRSKG